MTRTRTTALLLAASLVALGACSSSGEPNAPIPVPVPGGGTDATAPDTSDTTPGGGTVDPGALVPGSRRPIAEAAVVIVVDGWSEASMSAKGLRWRPAGTRTGVPLDLRPASADDLGELAARDPAAVEQLAARLVTADPTLRCDATSCATDTRTVEFTEIADPRTGHLLGALFAGWDIPTGVWVATTDAEQGAVVYGDSEFQIVPLDAQTAEAEGVEETGVRLIGQAFGALFPVDAQWVGGKATFVGYVPADNEPVTQLVAPGAFFSGLGSPVYGIGAMSASQLTWRTSPTTGCGVGVLCIPGVAETSSTVTDTRQVDVCSDTGRGVVELVAADVTYTYPAPSHQFGLWPDYPDGEIGGNKVVWTRDLPLIDGAQTMHFALALLHDSRGLVQIAGIVADHATATADEIALTYDAGDIETLFGGRVRPCN
jgi:hypothetical protein